MPSLPILLLVLTLLLSTARGCCVHRLQLAIVPSDHDHGGFHRILSFNASVRQRGKPCTASISHLLPIGMYVDPYEVQLEGVRIDNSTHDSESLAPDAQPMLLHMAIPIAGDAAQWHVPIHIRYGAARRCPPREPCTATVQLGDVQVLNACSALRIHGQDAHATVPVGNLLHTAVVVALTTASGLVGALYIIWYL